MPFNKKKFMTMHMTAREEAIPVPDLAAFFDDGETPVWVVRGLTGHELGKVNEAADRTKNIQALLEAVMSGDTKEKADGVKNLMGLGEDTPADVARRLDMLVHGSVEPACDYELAVRICRTFPIEFYGLTNKILELTGKGHVPGKAKPSGATRTSGLQSPCATPEGDSSTK